MEKISAVMQCQAILAIRSGRLSLAQASEKYQVSLDVVQSWVQKGEQAKTHIPLSARGESDRLAFDAHISSRTQDRILMEKTQATYRQSSPLERSPSEPSYHGSQESSSWLSLTTPDFS